jgi:hypothetical protein
MMMSIPLLVSATLLIHPLAPVVSRPESSKQHAMGTDDTRAHSADTLFQPEDTSLYREWARRAAENEKRYTQSYIRDRRDLEERILRGDIRDFMVEDYVLQLQVLGDEARIVDLCCRMSTVGRTCGEARKRLFKMAKGDLLEAKQYNEVLRVAGDIQTGYDKLIEKYQGSPENDKNWCELRYKGDCASEFHDAFAYFEALAGTDRRMDAVILAEKLIRTRIDPADLMAQSKYTIWKLPEDISTAGVLSQLIVSAERAGDATLYDALDALARSRQTESDLDAFREDVLGPQADEAKRRVSSSVFTDARKAKDEGNRRNRR